MTYHQSVVERARIAYEAWRESMYGWPVIEGPGLLESHAEYMRRLAQFRKKLRRFDQLEPWDRAAWIAAVEALDHRESITATPEEIERWKAELERNRKARMAR